MKRLFLPSTPSLPTLSTLSSKLSAAVLCFSALLSVLPLSVAAAAAAASASASATSASGSAEDGQAKANATTKATAKANAAAKAREHGHGHAPAYATANDGEKASSGTKARACYSPLEVQAEELLRLHSQLMVITVTCHQGSNGENLVPAYTTFTRDNIEDLHKAESIMKSHFKTRHGGDGTPQLDALRTRLGNEYGQQIADLSAPAFCDLYRDKVVALSQNIPGLLENEVARITQESRTLVPPCKTAGLKVAEKNR